MITGITAHWVTGHQAFEVGYKEPVAPPVSTASLYRVPHDCERDADLKFVWGKRNGSPSYRDFIISPIPAPFRVQPEQVVPIKNDPKLIDLLCALNPDFTRERVTFFLDVGLIWCNTQWGVFHTPLVTGGAVLEAERVEGGRVYFKSIRLGDPVPTAAEVLKQHMSYIATSVHRDGRVQIMTRANGSSGRSPVRMFMVRKTVEPLWLPENELHRLPQGFEPPSAIWMPG